MTTDYRSINYVDYNQLNMKSNDYYSQDTLDHCMKAYNHGPCSRMSITFNSSKGLTNAPGQNNCFLNSAVQVLWHLDAFRRSFRLLSGHSCMGNACIFCALKVMFTQFQYSDKAVLPPDALRQAMAETFANQQRFQMGLMDDAAECFENILMRIHTHIAPDESEDTCSIPYCLPHQKFSMSVSEMVTCGACGARSEPFTYNEMVFYVSTGALVTEHKACLDADQGDSVSFSSLLKNTVSKGDVRSCPESCGQFGVKQRNLLNCPDVVSIGLVWESAKSGGQHIRDVVDCIGTTLNLEELFHSSSSQPACNTQLQLVGVVCYYGKHYSTFFFHSKVQEWIYFDDAAVKQISNNWSRVCEKLCKGRHQPLLLLYMNPRTQAVDVSTAPKFSTMAAGYEWKTNSNSRHDEVDYSPHSGVSRQASNHTDGKDSGVYSGLSRQDSGLSRQDSGVSSYSSRSYHAEPDSLSSVSAITKHSSDSSSSGVRDMDAAMSYSSKASTVSSSTASSTVENGETGYAMSNNNHVRRSNSNSEVYNRSIESNELRKDKTKVSIKKKKAKNSSSRLDTDVVRYHSKSQADLSVPHECYDDASLTRSSPEAAEQKSFSYATLPRKKRVPLGSSSPVKSPETNPNDTTWMKDIAMKGELMKQKSNDEATSVPSVGSRIKMFNSITSEPSVTLPDTKLVKPPEMKPLLQLKQSEGQLGDKPSYISRSSVEKILHQQRKASKAPVTSKILRPTYEEQFVLPGDLSFENDKKVDLRFEMADNTSVGSLKDSGYRSLGDRGSNSASSAASSISAESPTMNHSFSFDTREPIYCEPPPISSEIQSNETADDDFDFPPPPSESELSAGHSKQLSEASLLSDASTLKQRKSPSVESLEDHNIPTQWREHISNDTWNNKPRSRSSAFNVQNLSTADSKLYSMVRSADEYISKSQEKEAMCDISTALVFCQQALNLLSSVTSQRPESSEFAKDISIKYDTCVKRTNLLQNKLNEAIKPSNEDKKKINGIEKKLMGELHIDDQTKRGHASSDYTPLHNAMNRLPSSRDPLEEKAGMRGVSLHRSESLLSNSSNGSHDRNQLLSGKKEELLDKPSLGNQSRQETGNYQYLPPKSRPTYNYSQTHSIYKEVNVPTTLQRHAYIREGCKPSERQTDGIIPPPKEFGEISEPNRCLAQSRKPVSRNAFCNNELSSQYTRNNHHEPTVSRPNSSQFKEAVLPLPPKQAINLNKKDIRDLLVQDMLKRQGQGHEPMRVPKSHDVPYNRSQSHPNFLPTNSSNSSSSNRRLYEPNLQPRYPNYNNYPNDTPLWTPPQQSAYDKGLSHYDSPTYQKRNTYGKVNVLSSSSYAGYNNQPTRTSMFNGPEDQAYHPQTKHLQNSGFTQQQPYTAPYSTEL